MRYFLKGAVVLLAALLMVTSLTAIANTSDKKNLAATGIEFDTPIKNVELLTSSNVLWNNFVEDYTGALASQHEPPGTPNRLDVFPADDFMFTANTDVFRVYWGGGYFGCNYAQGPKDYHFDWNITFFEDDGSGYHPGTIYAGPFTISDADLTKSVEVLNSTTESNGLWACGFFAWLPTPVTFNANTKYWITIYGIGEIFPQTSWGYHNQSVGGILLNEANFKSEYFGYPDWVNTTDVFGEPFDMLYALLGQDPDFEVTISRGLGVTATIKNQGIVDATNVTATITATGGIVLGRTKTEFIGDLNIDDTATAKVIFIGIGNIAVDVKVTCDEGMIGSGTASGFLLLILVL